MNGQQINVFEDLNIKDTFRIVLFEDLGLAVSKLPHSSHKHMKYTHYIDLIYKVAFNKTAERMRVNIKYKNK